MGKRRSLVGAVLLAVLGSGLIGTTHVATAPPAEAVQAKTTICHRTHSITNPYRRITVARASVSGNAGHQGHTPDNQVWTSSITSYATTPWGDIIPNGANGGPNGKDKNWTTAGQAIWNGATKVSSTGRGACRSMSPLEYYNSELAAGQSASSIIADLNDMDANEDTAYGTFTNVSSLSIVQVTTGTATLASNTQVALTGSVQLPATLPNGETTLPTYFEYGTNPDLSGATLVAATTGSSAPVNATTNIAKTLTGLTSSTTYYYRAVAITDLGADTEGAVQGEIRSFVTNTNAPVVTTSSLSTGYQNEAYSLTLARTGGTAPFTWSSTAGTLPTGLTLSSGGVLSGTPTQTGVFSISIKVTDNASVASSAVTLSLQILDRPRVTTSSLTSGVQNSAYSTTLGAAGGTGGYTNWRVDSGSLPSGLSLASNGTLSGTPTGTGTSNFAVTVDDSAGERSAAQSLALTIVASGSLTITTPSVPNGQVNVAYTSTQLQSVGGSGTLNWNVSSGALPGGLSLASNGTISGSPTSDGTFSFVAQVTDSSSNSDTESYSIVVSKRNQSIVFNRPGNRGVGAPNFAPGATSNSSRTVTYTSATPSVCSIVSGQVQVVTYGECIVDADESGNSEWNSASTVRQSFLILRAQTIAFTNPGQQNRSAGNVTPSVSANSNLAVTLTSQTPAVCAVSGGVVQPLTRGLCTVLAERAADDPTFYDEATDVTESFAFFDDQTLTLPVIANALESDSNITLAGSSDAGLPVQYTAGPAGVCAMAGGNQVDVLGTGTCSVTVTQPGDPSDYYNAAAPVTRSFSVSAAPSSSASPTPSSGSSLPIADKVTICHRTHATTNPYRLITVSTASVINESGNPDTNGHAWHDPDKGWIDANGRRIGPFRPDYAYPAKEKWWGDIIPPFQDKTSGRTYAGLNWSWSNPSVTSKSGSMGEWITEADFIAATASGGSAADQAAVAYCTGVQSAGVKTTAKFYEVEVTSGGQSPKDVVEDIKQQGAVNVDGSKLDVDPSTAWPKVRTDSALNVEPTKAVLPGALLTDDQWTNWKFEWSTSPTLVDPNSTASVSETRSGTKSVPISGLTPGTKYYFRIVGTHNVIDSDGTSRPLAIVGEIKEFTTPSRGDLEGFAWIDLDGDTRRSADEPRLAGVSAAVRSGKNVLGRVVTDSAGYFSVSGLPAGAVEVEMQLPTKVGLKRTWDSDSNDDWVTKATIVNGRVVTTEFAAVGEVELTGAVNVTGTTQTGRRVNVIGTWSGPDGELDTADDVPQSTTSSTRGTYLLRGFGFGPTRIVAQDPLTGVTGSPVVLRPSRASLRVKDVAVPSAPELSKQPDVLRKPLKVASRLSPQGETVLVAGSRKLRSGRIATVSVTCPNRASTSATRGDVSTDQLRCEFVEQRKGGAIILSAGAPSNRVYTVRVLAPATAKLGAFAYQKSFQS